MRSSAASRGLGATAIALNALGALGIVGLMLLINADVAGRALFNKPIRGVPEVVSLSIVAIVFFQAAYMLRSGRMIASDSLIGRLRSTRPSVAAAMDFVFSLLGATMFALLLWASTPGFVEAWRDDLFVGAEGDFTIPTWPTKGVILVGSAMLCLQYLELALEAARHLVQGLRSKRPGHG
jgi:TRAP-type C4-dicarboxylate transport system permease small subunit